MELMDPIPREHSSDE